MTANPRFFDFLRACSALLAVTILAPVASATSPVQVDRDRANVAGFMDNDPPVYDARLQIAGNLHVGIVNCGLLGQSLRMSAHPMGDPAFPPADSVSQFFEFPAGSHALHLYQGGLWIGGVVDGDTLVTTALNAVSFEAREFTAFDSMQVSSNIPGSAFYDPSALSHQQFYCRFTDTLSVRYSDELDNRPHYPVGVEVAQTSHAWLSEPYDDFILVVSTIRNISDHLIEGLRFGMFTDADCYTRFPNRRAGLDAFSDDVSGYLGDQGIGYTIDNDGDPVGDTLWDSTSVRSAYSVVPIAIEPEPCCTTFNWWGLYYDRPWPSGQIDEAEPPRGDRGYYRAMASGTIEDDQIFFAASSGESPRDSIRPYDGVAAGADTRFLLAFGSYDLLPGDSVRFVYAFVAGDSVHQNPSDFATKFDAGDPYPFYNSLYFGDLIRNADAARFIYNNDFDLIGGAPPLVTFKPLSDSSVEIRWVAAPFHAIAGYRIYRRIIQPSSEWELIEETVGADTLWFTDRSLSSQLDYEYAVSAIGTDGQEGFKSQSFPFKAGLPQVVPSIKVAEDKMDITITWSVASPKGTFAPPAYINIYRRATGDSAAALQARFPVISQTSGATLRTGDQLAAGAVTRLPLRPPADLMGTYNDQDVQSGIEYWYSASVTNTLGREGRRSEEVRTVPMALDHPGIVLIEMVFSPPERPLNLIVSDSTVEFYSLWARGRGLDTLTVQAYCGWEGCCCPWRDSAYALTHLSQYATTVFVWEDVGAVALADKWIGGMADYLKAGGRCIMIGRNIPAQLSHVSPGLYGPSNREVDLVPDRFGSSVLGVNRVILEGSAVARSLVQTEYDFYLEFVGAPSASAAYPDLAVDTARALSIPLLAHPDSRVFGDGLVPAVGALTSFADAEVLYTYGASHPDTSSLQGLPVAIKGTNPDVQFILFDFPMSLMNRDAAYQALDAAFADLNNSSSTAKRPPRPVTIDDILDYIYHCTGKPPDPAFDTNGDGVIDLRDAVRAINDR